MPHSVTRYHDISCGHRVVGHESKCQHLHGHNYRVHFTCVPTEDLDKVGRVIDFSVIKTKLCQWLEDNWDHKMLLYIKDPIVHHIDLADPKGLQIVPFNPTAENMAYHLVEHIGPVVLKGTGARLVKCVVEETRKCSATYEKANS
jgi:6-pyruvoyltetrahydropterin/6-carboxytetrahydropterin synthase